MLVRRKIRKLPLQAVDVFLSLGAQPIRVFLSCLGYTWETGVLTTGRHPGLSVHSHPLVAI